jgi:hypothetical protein
VLLHLLAAGHWLLAIGYWLLLQDLGYEEQDLFYRLKCKTPGRWALHSHIGYLLYVGCWLLKDLV